MSTAFAAACAVAALAVACQNHVYSPPGRTAPLDTSWTLGADRTALRAGIGAHAAPDGFSAGSGSLHVSHGLAAGVDGSIEGMSLRIGGDSAAGTDRWIYALRGGAKVQLLEGIALSSGVGGGLSAAGGFVSPDVSMIAGPEEYGPGLWFQPRVALSIPIAPREVDTTALGDPPQTEVATPRTTLFVGADVGVRLRAKLADHPGASELTLIGAVGVTLMSDWDVEEEAFTIASAVEIVP